MFRLPAWKGGSIDLTGRLGCWFPLVEAGWLARQFGWKRGFGVGTVTSTWQECKKSQYPKARLLDDLHRRQLNGTEAHGTDYIVWMCAPCLARRTCRYACGGGYMVGNFFKNVLFSVSFIFFVEILWCVFRNICNSMTVVCWKNAARCVFAILKDTKIVLLLNCRLGLSTSSLSLPNQQHWCGLCWNHVLPKRGGGRTR